MIKVLQDVGFGYREFPIDDIEEFAFDAADVAPTEDAATEGPVVVLDRPVVDIL